jgi:hypothetical protein
MGITLMDTAGVATWLAALHPYQQTIVGVIGFGGVIMDRKEPQMGPCFRSPDDLAFATLSDRPVESERWISSGVPNRPADEVTCISRPASSRCAASPASFTAEAQGAGAPVGECHRGLIGQPFGPASPARGREPTRWPAPELANPMVRDG